MPELTKKQREEVEQSTIEIIDIMEKNFGLKKNNKEYNNIYTYLFRDFKKHLLEDRTNSVPPIPARVTFMVNFINYCKTQNKTIAKQFIDYLKNYYKKENKNMLDEDTIVMTKTLKHFK